MSKLRTRREFLRLSAMAGAGAVLAACVPVTPTPAPEAAPAATPPPKEKVKLIAWFADRRTINLMTEEVMQTEFQPRNPDIEVEVQFVPESEIPPKMATAYSAGQAPDITALDESELPGFLNQAFINAIPETVIDVRKEMGDRIADVYQIGGKYYALPNGNMPQILFCNVDLLDQNGLTVDDIPSKWDDFIEWAKELTVWEGDEITQWGYTVVGAPWAWDSIATQKGSFMFKNDKESNFDDPVIAEAWQFMLDLFDVHKLEFRNAPLGGPHERVAQGLAFTGAQFGFGAGWFPTQYPDTNWGTVPQPTFTGQPPYGRASDDLGFCNTTQRETEAEIEAVWTLWRYLVGPDYQRRYCPLRGVHPSLLVLSTEEQFTESNPEWYGIALTTKPEGFRADGVWPAEVTPLLHQDCWERIVNVGDPIEDVLADHKTKIEKILAELDLPLLTGKEGWKAEWEQPGS